VGKDIDALFGGSTKNEAFFSGLMKDPSLVIAAWQVVLDDPSQFSKLVGVKGTFWALKGNDNMEEFAGTLAKYNPSRAWKDYVKTHWNEILDNNGLPSASDGRWAWGLGYTFHIIRKRVFALGDDAVAKMWPGGPTGAGTRLLRYWLTDEHFFTKPLTRGAKSIVLPVSTEWSSKLSREVSSRLVGNAKCDFPVGFAMAWAGGRNDEGRGGTVSLHGLWDLLCVVNNIYAGGGASVFSQITDATMRRRIGSAFEAIVENVRTNANDFSGYKETGEESKEVYRKACKEEIPKSGFQYILKNFGRL
jgi:hypothetical protein